MQTTSKTMRLLLYAAYGLLAAVLLGMNAGLLFHTAQNGTYDVVERTTLLLAASASLLLLFIFLHVLRLALTGQRLSASGELLAAADWILSTMEKDTPVPQPGGKPAETVQQRIEQWLRRREEECARQVDEHIREWSSELQLATDFQQAMMQRPYPQVPEILIPGRLRLNFFHAYRAASGLGGDFFDITKVDRDAAGIFIADVMGHGTRSALITSMLRSLMAEASSVGRNAPRFLEQINRNFCSIMSDMPELIFASAHYFVADTTARMATYASAGHPAPLHVRRAPTRIEHLPLPTPRPATLGICPNEFFPGISVRLQPGDIFLFFTDGLMEAFNEHDEEFGEERARLVIERHIYQDIKTISEALIEAVIQWTGGKPMTDDICLVALEVTTASPPPPPEEIKNHA